MPTKIPRISLVPKILSRRRKKTRLRRRRSRRRQSVTPPHPIRLSADQDPPRIQISGLPGGGISTPIPSSTSFRKLPTTAARRTKSQGDQVNPRSRPSNSDEDDDFESINSPCVVCSRTSYNGLTPRNRFNAYRSRPGDCLKSSVPSSVVQSYESDRLLFFSVKPGSSLTSGLRTVCSLECIVHLRQLIQDKRYRFVSTNLLEDDQGMTGLISRSKSGQLSDYLDVDSTVRLFRIRYIRGVETVRPAYVNDYRRHSSLKSSSSPSSTSSAVASSSSSSSNFLSPTQASKSSPTHRRQISTDYTRSTYALESSTDRIVKSKSVSAIRHGHHRRKHTIDVHHLTPDRFCLEPLSSDFAANLVCRDASAGTTLYHHSRTQGEPLPGHLSMNEAVVCSASTPLDPSGLYVGTKRGHIYRLHLGECSKDDLRGPPSSSSSSLPPTTQAWRRGRPGADPLARGESHLVLDLNRRDEFVRPFKLPMNEVQCRRYLSGVGLHDIAFAPFPNDTDGTSDSPTCRRRRRLRLIIYYSCQYYEESFDGPARRRRSKTPSLYNNLVAVTNLYQSGREYDVRRTRIRRLYLHRPTARHTIPVFDVADFQILLQVPLDSRHGGTRYEPGHDLTDVFSTRLRVGGRLLYCPDDRKLYLATADASDVQPNFNPQDIFCPHGKLLRLDLDRRDHIPTDNPMRSVLPHILAHLSDRFIPLTDEHRKWILLTVAHGLTDPISIEYLQLRSKLVSRARRRRCRRRQQQSSHQSRPSHLKFIAITSRGRRTHTFVHLYELPAPRNLSAYYLQTLRLSSPRIIDDDDDRRSTRSTGASPPSEPDTDSMCSPRTVTACLPNLGWPYFSGTHTYCTDSQARSEGFRPRQDLLDHRWRLDLPVVQIDFPFVTSSAITAGVVTPAATADASSTSLDHQPPPRHHRQRRRRYQRRRYMMLTDGLGSVVYVDLFDRERLWQTESYACRADLKKTYTHLATDHRGRPYLFTYEIHTPEAIRDYASAQGATIDLIESVFDVAVCRCFYVRRRFVSSHQ